MIILLHSAVNLSNISEHLTTEWVMSQHPASMPTLALTISCSIIMIIDQSVSSTGTLSKDLPLTLHSIFGSLLSSASYLVDRMVVTLVRGEKVGRVVVIVRGSGGLRYMKRVNVETVPDRKLIQLIEDIVE